MRALLLGHVEIDPFDPKRINPNSYNVRLGRELIYYDQFAFFDLAAPPPEGERILIPPTGLILRSEGFYLGTTIERTRTDQFFAPILEGRSTVARKGLMVHVSAGFGDVGFDGTWTLELVAKCRVRVYPGFEVAQIGFVPVLGADALYTGRYQKQDGPTPAR